MTRINKKNKGDFFRFSETSSEKLRFLVIGAINTFFGIALYFLMYLCFGSTLGYIGSLLAGYLVSSTIAFFLFRKFVFTSERSNRGISAYFKFHLVYILPLTFNILSLPALVELGGLNPYVAQVVFSLTWIIYSYVSHTRFTFAAQSGTHSKVTNSSR